MNRDSKIHISTIETYIFVIVSLLFLSPSLYAQSYTVRGGSGEPYMIEDTRNRIQVYIVNGAENVEISYTSTSSPHAWYRFNTRFLDREPIPCSQIGATSTIRNVEDGYGYCVYREGELLNAVWIIDYAKHPFNLQSLTVNTQDACSNQVKLSGSPALDELFYMTPNGVKTPVSRDLMVSFSSLEWSDESSMFQEIERNETLSSLGETIDDVLIPTVFCVDGDRFSQHFRSSASVCSDEYMPQGIELRIDTALVANEVENMSGGQTGLSAPATIRFSALTNEPIATIFSWRIYRKDAPDNPLIYYTEPEVEYTFTNYGEYVAEVEVSDASGTCSKFDQIEISIAESFLDVPNAFSPGTTPGVNDEFRVVYKSLVKFSCWIFNKWGQVLYHWTDPAKGWDGKKNGKYVSPGAYFYLIEAEGSDGIVYKKKGDINILRPKTIDDQIHPDEGL